MQNPKPFSKQKLKTKQNKTFKKQKLKKPSKFDKQKLRNKKTKQFFCKKN